jgi:hypothetical protein
MAERLRFVRAASLSVDVFDHESRGCRAALPNPVRVAVENAVNAVFGRDAAGRQAVSTPSGASRRRAGDRRTAVGDRLAIDGDRLPIGPALISRELTLVRSALKE